MSERNRGSAPTLGSLCLSAWSSLCWLFGAKREDIELHICTPRCRAFLVHTDRIQDSLEAKIVPPFGDVRPDWGRCWQRMAVPIGFGQYVVSVAYREDDATDHDAEPTAIAVPSDRGTQREGLGIGNSSS
jgi:hypothetical protein